MHCFLAVSLSLSLSVSVTTYITVNKTIYNYMIITIYMIPEKLFTLTCIICGDVSLATNHALGQPTLNSIIYFIAPYIVCMNDTVQSGPKVDECIYRYLVISTAVQRFSGNDQKARHAIVRFRVSFHWHRAGLYMWYHVWGHVVLSTAIKTHFVFVSGFGSFVSTIYCQSKMWLNCRIICV